LSLWIMLNYSGPPREYLVPRSKGNLPPPSSNSPNNDTQTKSTRCVISKESVQQKWFDELWFRKQLCIVYLSWAPGCRPGWPPPSQWACFDSITMHSNGYFIFIYKMLLLETGSCIVLLDTILLLPGLDNKD